MRERLVVAFLALTVAVVAVFLVERAYTTSELIETEARGEVARSAEILAAIVGGTVEQPTADQLGAALTDGERVEYVAPDGERVVADRGAGGGARDSDDLVASRDVAGGGTVTLVRRAGVVDDQVADELLPLVLLALVLLGISGLAAVLLARRLSRPFVELAEVAERVGRGDFAVPTRSYGIPEADAVAVALRNGARELDVLLRRERDFAVSASHDLRTPITALRLELEDLALSPETPARTVTGISRALGQLDRLSSSVATMLDRDRASRVGASVEIDLAALVTDTVQRWRRLAPHRSVEVAVDRVVAARVPAGSVMQVLDVLIGNAVAHGSGAVVVSLEAHDGYGELCVSDEGPQSGALEASRTPLASGAGGLATATQVAASFGGQLRLAEGDTTTFTLVVPLSRPAPAPEPPPSALGRSRRTSRQRRVKPKTR